MTIEEKEGICDAVLKNGLKNILRNEKLKEKTRESITADVYKRQAVSGY